MGKVRHSKFFRTGKSFGWKNPDKSEVYCNVFGQASRPDDFFTRFCDKEPDYPLNLGDLKWLL